MSIITLTGRYNAFTACCLLRERQGKLQRSEPSLTITRPEVNAYEEK